MKVKKRWEHKNLTLVVRNAYTLGAYCCIAGADGCDIAVPMAPFPEQSVYISPSPDASTVVEPQG